MSPIFEDENTTREKLYELYWLRGLSIARIANLMHVGVATIFRNMTKLGIPRRPPNEAIRLTKLGELNPRWGGDNIKPKSGRLRAQRMYPLQPCRICGKPAERHHKDDDPLNNNADNIDFLCRKHHMEADERLKERNQRGQFTGGECALLP